MRDAVLPEPAMHHTGLPPDKNKRLRSCRGNTVLFASIRLSDSRILVSVGAKKWYQLWYSQIVSVRSVAIPSRS